MNKLQMDPPLGSGTAPRLVVKAQRVARPPTPWVWAIYEEGQAYPVRCSTRLYRSAEDAWAVGHAMLSRLPESAIKARAPAQQDTALHDAPALR
jgi:hypothetical protein